MKSSIVALAILLVVAACGSAGQDWTGYALRDRPGEDGTRLIGAYATAEGCRAALLAGASDPGSEALVCTRGCPHPRDGMLDGCAETKVVRPASSWQAEPADALTPPAAPAGAADRSPGSGSSPL